MSVNPLRHASRFAFVVLASAAASAASAQSGGLNSARGAGSSGDTLSSVTNFLGNVETILDAASIAVVTFAIIFAGYQIAFNTKRISDVAPVLIGGVLIGGATQLATMLVGT
jgi:type IV secretion system protein VirB2